MSGSVEAQAGVLYPSAYCAFRYIIVICMHAQFAHLHTLCVLFFNCLFLYVRVMNDIWF